MTNLVSNQNIPSQINLHKEALEEISEQLNRVTPLVPQEIKTFYAKLFTGAIKDYAQQLLQDAYSIPSLIDKLHRAFCCAIKKQYVDISSTGAQWALDQQTNEKLFILKYSYLQEHNRFGVPITGGCVRERLYYRLDTQHFAGVPPTFRVKINANMTVSAQLFVEGRSIVLIIGNNAEQNLYRASIRKCIIHQFRAVNMDPSAQNVLIISQPEAAAIPVDGGYSLPFQVNGSERFIRLDYDLQKRCELGSLFDSPFFEEPFYQEEIDYIENINFQRDNELLNSYLSGEANYKSTIRICQIANQILKKAVGVSLNDKQQNKEVTITLNDLSIIRESQSIFKWIIQAKDESEIDQRIEQIFNCLCLMKAAVVAHRKDVVDDQNFVKSEKLEDLAIEMISQFSLSQLGQLPEEQVKEYKAILGRYILGAATFSTHYSLEKNPMLHGIIRKL